MSNNLRFYSRNPWVGSGRTAKREAAEQAAKLAEEIPRAVIRKLSSDYMESQIKDIEETIRLAKEGYSVGEDLAEAQAKLERLQGRSPEDIDKEVALALVEAEQSDNPEQQELAANVRNEINKRLAPALKTAERLRQGQERDWQTVEPEFEHLPPRQIEAAARGVALDGHIDNKDRRLSGFAQMARDYPDEFFEEIKRKRTGSLADRRDADYIESAVMSGRIPHEPDAEDVPSQERISAMNPDEIESVWNAEERARFPHGRVREAHTVDQGGPDEQADLSAEDADELLRKEALERPESKGVASWGRRQRLGIGS